MRIWVISPRVFGEQPFLRASRTYQDRKLFLSASTQHCGGWTVQPFKSVCKQPSGEESLFSTGIIGSGTCAWALSRHRIRVVETGYFGRSLNTRETDTAAKQGFAPSQLTLVLACSGLCCGGASSWRSLQGCSSHLLMVCVLSYGCNCGLRGPLI